VRILRDDQDHHDPSGTVQLTDSVIGKYYHFSNILFGSEEERPVDSMTIPVIGSGLRCSPKNYLLGVIERRIYAAHK
jgi:hypothetical protein